MICLKETRLPQYDYIHKFYHEDYEFFYCVHEACVEEGTLHAVDTHGKHGLIDCAGKVLIPFEFDDLDRKFHFIITAIFTDAAEKELFRQRKAQGKLSREYYAWDDLGRYNLGERLRMHNGITKSRFGLYTIWGAELLPCIYDSIWISKSEGYFLAYVNENAPGELCMELPWMTSRYPNIECDPLRPLGGEHQGEIFTVVDVSDADGPKTLMGYKNSAGVVTIPPECVRLQQIGKRHLLAVRKRADHGGFTRFYWEMLDEDGHTVFEEVANFLWWCDYDVPCILMASVEPGVGGAGGAYPVDLDGNVLLDRLFFNYVSPEGRSSGFTALDENGWVFLEITQENK